MKVLPVLILCFTTVALADDFKLVSGKKKRHSQSGRARRDCAQKQIGNLESLFRRAIAGCSETFSVQCGDCLCLFCTTSSQSSDDGRRPSRPTGRSDFARYADWCGPCRRLSPSLEQMASSDSEVALRKIDIVNWRTPVVQQFNIHSIPQVNVYDRSGRLVGTVVGVDFEKVKSYGAQAKSSG